MRDLADDPFASLPSNLKPLAARGVIKAVRKGERVIVEGRMGDELYIILAGRLRAYSRNDKGREITYGIYGPGEYLGEMSLDGGPRSASVVAVEASRCAMVTRQTLLQYIGEHPDFALELIGKLIRRARAATLSARQLALNDAYGRLKLLLESLALPQTDGTSIVAEALSHRDIAHRVGCSREMVTRLMKDLRDGAYISESARGLALRKLLPGRW
jgi:CRP/FNR family cyclic AMP-dependent transcriptional regulator